MKIWESATLYIILTSTKKKLKSIQPVLLNPGAPLLFVARSIAAKCNEVNTIWIQTEHGQLPSQGHTDGLCMQKNCH